MTTMRVQPEPSSAAFASVSNVSGAALGALTGALPGKDPLTAAVAAAISAMLAADKQNVPIVNSEQTEAGLMGSQNVASYVETDQNNSAKLSDHSIAV